MTKTQAAENVNWMHDPNTKQLIASNFCFIDSILVILMWKMHQVVEANFWNNWWNNENRRLRLSCKNCFDCSGAKHSIRIFWYHLNKFGYKNKACSKGDTWGNAKKHNPQNFNCESLLKLLNTTSSENGCSRITGSQHKRWPKRNWRPRRFCYVFGAIGRESSIMSSSSTAQFLMQTSTVNNWTIWVV